MLYNDRQEPSGLSVEEINELLKMEDARHNFMVKKITIQEHDYILWATVDYRGYPTAGLIDISTGEMFGMGLASPQQVRRFNDKVVRKARAKDKWDDLPYELKKFLEESGRI